MLELPKIKKVTQEDLVMLILIPLIMLIKDYLWLVPMLMEDQLDVIYLNLEPEEEDQEEATEVVVEEDSEADLAEDAVADSAEDVVVEEALTLIELLPKEILMDSKVQEKCYEFDIFFV